MQRRTKWSPVAGFVAMLLTMTACVKDVEAPVDVPMNDETATTSQVPQRSSDASAPASPNSGTQPIEPPGSEAVQAAHCLHATWSADAVQVAALQQLGTGIDEVSGAVQLTFDDDGAFTVRYEDWHVTASPDGEPIMVLRDGADTGLYSITDNTISLVETTIGSMMTAVVDGVETPIEPLPMEISDATFTCEAGQASVTAPEGVLQLTRN